MESKRNDLLYTNVFKGLMITFVVVGHAILLVLPEITNSTEKYVYMLLGKLLIPSVFAFFCFFGYSQGLSRKKMTKDKMKKRVKSTFFSYVIWASIAWIVFSLLGPGYNSVNNSFHYTKGMFFPINYFGSVMSFAVSWQYYFICIFIFGIFFLYFFRNTPLEKLKRYLYIFLGIQAAFYTFISLFLWMASPSERSIRILGICTYINPGSWILPLFWGYYRGAEKKDIFGGLKPVVLIPMAVVFFFLSSTEMFFLSGKWNAYCVMDHFTLLTLINSIFMMFIYKKFVEWMISIRAIWFRNLLDGLSTMGMFSIIPFYVHMPYQWFVFYFIKSTFFPQINTLLSFILLSIIGLMISYLSIVGIRLLPKKQKKVLLGI
ncbi:MAG TPA: hypothetical protein PK466_08055 [Thermotogota bacterium]|mgnify:CR=1 FL=1|nr:hypothetical protein [Thermotogota bacterium]HPJ88766.1 hypothetical protein [Thermotogota bacterium]HPR96269.1 hypothetical protein [Thermotogota bacterium]